MKIIIPEILIISNMHDYACDYIADILNNKGISFLRLNTDDLMNIKINMDPIALIVEGEFENLHFYIDPHKLKSIYFRGPVFLREIWTRDYLPEEQLSRSQWAAFIRSFMIYTECKWVNHPMYTYRAESKPFQLSFAKKVGFKVPNTIIANNSFHNSILNCQNDYMILKGLDTIILNINRDHKGFVYTNLVKKEEIYQASLSDAPVIIQDSIEPKIDIRVTVIGNKLFAVKILENNNGIVGDWRLRKNTVRYIPCKLPDKIKQCCFRLLKNLKLNYGAIDLAQTDNDYYFLEINPTGEWAWLVEKLNLKIDYAIANLLMG